jgi:hypothetical protein
MISDVLKSDFFEISIGVQKRSRVAERAMVKFHDSGARLNIVSGFFAALLFLQK